MTKGGSCLDEQLPITRRQFHILLNQIQMTDDDLSRYFEEGEIVKLTVQR
ncbi:PolC-type DNA polymerase III N-terminal domain-containing protein [Bacillus sp. SL00103]